jgi:hypothetical protein
MTPTIDVTPSTCLPLMPKRMGIGNWLLVAGRWSLVAGRWSLVAGRWWLGYREFPL